MYDILIKRTKEFGKKIFGISLISITLHDRVTIYFNHTQIKIKMKTPFMQ